MLSQSEIRRAGGAAGPLGLSRGEADTSKIATNYPGTQEQRRRQCLVEHLHRLGPSPLGHFIREVEVATGADVTARLKRYAEIDPEFVRALGLHCIDGGAR
jgi:hypothetical protein